MIINQLEKVDNDIQQMLFLESFMDDFGVSGKGVINFMYVYIFMRFIRKIIFIGVEMKKKK